MLCSTTSTTEVQVNVDLTGVRAVCLTVGLSWATKTCFATTIIPIDLFLIGGTHYATDPTEPNIYQAQALYYGDGKVKIKAKQEPAAAYLYVLY